ncbi:MAG: dockerin type I repeat-containing protein [Ruminococcus sp.]|nr:dockerin type I repeat-containing protein [Ruminococcus sp.]
MIKRVLSLILSFLMIMCAVSVMTAQAAPVVSVESLVITPYMGSFGEIKLKVTGATDVTYQWQAGFFDSTFDPVDLDDNEYYIGTKTNHFKLLASGELDSLDFRCKITYNGGKVYSQVFHFTFLDPKVISRAYIVGVDAPVFGYGPKYRTDDVLSEQYDLDSMVWYGPIKGSSAPLMKSTDVYVEGKYKCRFYLDPAEGYTFNENSVCSVDGIICNVYSETSDDGTIAYYADRVYTISYKGNLPEGILDFESRKPDASLGEQDVYMGTFCLGTSDMDTEFSFTTKALPSSMSSNGYYIFGKTSFIKDGRVLRDITGTSAKLSTLIISEEGRYTLEQKICLMSPSLEVMETRTQSYIVDIIKPQTLTEVSVTFDNIENWVRPLYSPVAVTPGVCVESTMWNDMTLDGKYVPAGTDFIDGHTYRMGIWIKTKPGYVFAVDEDGCPDITAKVNGMPAEVVPAVSSTAAEIVFEFTYEVESTDAPTSVPTDCPTTPTPPTTSPSEPVFTGILGDANLDGEVNIKDATAIQKYTAQLEALTDTGLILADVDASADVNIKDATAIQKYIAGIDTGLPIGESV